MSITNRSVDVRTSTAHLEALLEGYQHSYDRIMDGPEAEIDDAQLEWLESGIEIIEDELAKREDAEPVPDSPSLQDIGQHPGSYAS